MLRRVVHPVLILILGMVAATKAIAQSEPVPGFYVRGQLGYGWPSMRDIDAQISAEEVALRPATTLLDWEELGGGTRFLGEAGYRISPVFSLGLEFGYQKISRDHSATLLFDSGTAIVSGTIDRTVKAGLFTVLLTPTITLPSAPGFHFGGQIGMGRGSFERIESDNIGATDGTFVVGTFTEDYDETALAGGLFAGWDFSMSPEVAFSIRAGYLMSNFSKMDGTLTAEGSTELGPFFDSFPGQLTDSDGDPMEVNFSGLNLNVGLLLRFGTNR